MLMRVQVRCQLMLQVGLLFYNGFCPSDPTTKRLADVRRPGTFRILLLTADAGLAEPEKTAHLLTLHRSVGDRRLGMLYTDLEPAGSPTHKLFP